MHRETKSTHVLMVGVDEKQWIFEKDLLKGGLQSADMAWSLTCGMVSSTREALDYIEGCTDLEIVDLSLGTRKVDMGDALLIARALRSHPHKPWVALGEPSPLDMVFAGEGIHFEHGMLEEVIFSRWSTQASKEEAAPRYMH